MNVMRRCEREHRTEVEKLWLTPNGSISIVTERITTALVIEDDADWDVTLKTQLMDFAQGVRIIQNSTGPSVSAYGSNWDMLWIGHCGANLHPDEKRFYAIPNDMTVRPAHHSSDLITPEIVDGENMQNTTRLIFKAGAAECTYGYAVNFDSARKILAALSMSPVNEPVDWEYWKMCDGRKGSNFSCITPFPSLIGSWRPAGPGSKDSDIRNEADDWHEAYSRGIVYSTMLNIHRLLAGEKMIHSQWEDVLLPVLNLDQVGPAEGYLHTIDTAISATSN